MSKTKHKFIPTILILPLYLILTYHIRKNTTHTYSAGLSASVDGASLAGASSGAAVSLTESLFVLVAGSSFFSSSDVGASALSSFAPFSVASGSLKKKTVNNFYIPNITNTML